MRQRLTMRYRGRVQGVGFRYTACRMAGDTSLTGYVQNLANGEVQLVAEGDIDELERFLSALEIELGRHISGRDRIQGPPTGEFPDFRIRY